jgi:hypothetical protein
VRCPPGFRPPQGFRSPGRSPCFHGLPLSSFPGARARRTLVRSPGSSRAGSLADLSRDPPALPRLTASSNRSPFEPRPDRAHRFAAGSSRASPRVPSSRWGPCRRLYRSRGVPRVGYLSLAAPFVPPFAAKREQALCQAERPSSLANLARIVTLFFHRLPTGVAGLDGDVEKRVDKPARLAIRIRSPAPVRALGRDRSGAARRRSTSRKASATERGCSLQCHSVRHEVR